MKLIDIVENTVSDELWDGNYKIPWDEPGFSQRMLQIHLSQDDDLASRRLKTIDSHLNWIKTNVLPSGPARVLDLACGPGLYSQKLTQQGHECFGVDFSPASIEHANQHNPDPDRCRFALGDLRTADFGGEYDIALMIYGEFNAFPDDEVLAIIQKAHQALKPGGRLLIEAHTLEEIERIGLAPSSWYRATSGLFSERPHLCLIDTRWHADEQTAEAVFYVVDAADASVRRYRNTLQGYTADEYRDLFNEAGFSQVDILPEWDKPETTPEDSFVLILAQK